MTFSAPPCQNIVYAAHNVLGAGQRDSISQRPVTVGGQDFLTIRAALCPALRQPHEPFTFSFRGKADTAPGRIVLIPKGKGTYRAGYRRRTHADNYLYG